MNAILRTETVYCVEPIQNIALARNRALENAKGEFVAFIDDDEFPTSEWLLNLWKCCTASQCGGVLGPVLPFFDQEPPRWVIKGGFFDRPRHQTGTVLESEQTRSGNVLIRRAILKGVAEPFLRIYGSGSEDVDFFRRMIAAGHKFIWCNEAAVYEVVPPPRWKRSYLLKRAWLQGQNQRHSAGFSSIIKSVIALPAYSLFLPVLCFAGHDMVMRYLLKVADHSGKLLGIAGITTGKGKYLSSS